MAKSINSIPPRGNTLNARYTGFVLASCSYPVHTSQTLAWTKPWVYK